MLITYVLILAVVVVVLYGSYRALAGGEAVAADDYRALLARLCEFTSRRATELGEALAAPAAAAQPDGGGRTVDPLLEAARDPSGQRVRGPQRSQPPWAEVIATIHGPARGILTAERTALNFLCRMSGVASATAALVAAVSAHKARICCTRKTMPGLRAIEKYAVRAGGGANASASTTPC